MAEAIRSSVSRAAEIFAAHVRSLPSASSLSSPTPACNIKKIQEDTRQLVRMLGAIRARLDDAEKKEITDDLVRYWLRELEALAYEAEDVLDEFAYKATCMRLMEDGGFTPRKRKSMEGTGLQVSSSISSTGSHEIIAFLNDVEQRIEMISTRFDEITKHKQALSFEESYRQRHVEKPARQPTSSLMNEPCIFGRKKDLATVEKFLLSHVKPSRSNDVPVMAIVGMGGLGKTTLAQLVYNDPAISKHFDLKLWVCVAEDFDVVRLTRAILESISLEACNISELDALQKILKEKLNPKGLGKQKFLLVLDDIWEAQNLSSSWDRLIASLCHGSEESKIIITTRSIKVSNMIRATSTHHLSCLQDEDCLKLFNRRAFEDRDPSLCDNLMAVGEKIAKKCRGLPLVAKTLGALLHAIDDEETWTDILESDVWNIHEENEVMPVLRLSYEHLPPHLKRCFRYCSVFPKGHMFEKDRLVRMWVALGYVQAKGKKSMEDIANEYFDDLLCRSFFQYSHKFFQYSQEPQGFLMHDLIHDLARCISEGECCSVEDDRPCLIPRHVWHFSIVVTSDPIRYKTSTDGTPESTSLGLNVSELGSLRSFVLFSTTFRRFNKTKLLNDLFTRMKHLRVLDLSTIQLSEFPNSISHLKHLRFLGLPKNVIGEHSDFGQFQSSPINNLFDRLPDSIASLLNLRHLIYDKNVMSVEYPMGIGKLTDLQTMPGFRVSPKYDCAKLGELKDMNNIQGSLVITGINKLTNANEAKKACLEKKEHLWSLDLRWDEYWTYPLERKETRTSQFSINDEVLESLKPCPKLERLEIFSFYGQSPPSWLGDQSLSKLATVKLDKCQNWTSLPPLGQLPSLKCLFIKSAHGVNYIGSEFFSGGFPRLETLTLEDMGSWKTWCGAQKGECHQLKKLHIERCTNLESLSVINLDALRNLQIKECPKLQFSSSSLQLRQQLSLQEIVMRTIDGVGRIHGVFPHGFDTSYLELENVGQSEVLSVLVECSHIRRLIVARCENLTSLPLGNLKALEYMEIIECPQLQLSSGSLPLRQLSSLHELNVRDICGVGRIHGFFSHGATRSLETSCLELENVGQLEASSLLGECFPICQLSVARCESLASLPLGSLNALQYLRISECSPTLKQWCERNRQRLAHLQRMDIEAKGGENLYLVLQNVPSVRKVGGACLWKRGSLRTLELEWDCNTGIRSCAAAAAEQLFEKLRPHRILNKLVIRGYMGLRFPNWLGDPSFSNLFCRIPG